MACARFCLLGPFALNGSRSSMALSRAASAQVLFHACAFSARLSPRGGGGPIEQQAASSFHEGVSSPIESFSLSLSTMVSRNPSGPFRSHAPAAGPDSAIAPSAASGTSPQSTPTPPRRRRPCRWSPWAPDRTRCTGRCAASRARVRERARACQTRGGARRGVAAVPGIIEDSGGAPSLLLTSLGQDAQRRRGVEPPHEDGDER